MPQNSFEAGTSARCGVPKLSQSRLVRDLDLSETAVSQILGHIL